MSLLEKHEEKDRRLEKQEKQIEEFKRQLAELQTS